MPYRGPRPDSLRSLVGTALENTKKLISDGADGAAIEPEVKEHIRLYVETWILPQLEQANAKLNKK